MELLKLKAPFFFEMKIILKILLFVSTFPLFLGNLFSEDLRNISVGSEIYNIDDRGYVNFKCLDNTIINSWKKFTKCNISQDNLYIVNFEYDERFALNENFEGTQVAGHPALINLAIDKKGVLQEININTDPKAPFYFRKQSHLLWLRVYNKYGSDGWICDEKEQLQNHIKIGKKYINRSCSKEIGNKLITIDSHFYFIDEKSSRENLVSKSYLQIKLKQ